MKFDILIPHFKQGKVTTYTISQLLKNKGKHEIEIYVINNNSGDSSEKYFAPFEGQIKYHEYPKDIIQSHGVSFDWILPKTKNEWFITIESDGFPTNDTWLDYYENLINDGHDGAISLLKLSGGIYGHPCGGLYNKKVWQEAKRYCNEVQYAYFPNMSVSGGFDCHLMIHKDIVEKVLAEPYDYIELAEGYKGLTRQQMVARIMYYSPVVGPFHNGMGRLNETLRTYGHRTPETEIPNVLLTDKPKLINRVGYEPGQWLYYYQMATGKKIFHVPTETKWLPNRENQQQEYTQMENGFKHIWAGSSYLDMKDGDFHDVYEFKNNLIESLYNSLPNNQKIK